MKYKLLLFLVLVSSTLVAGDIRGGDIRIEQLSPFTVRATINLNVIIHSDITQLEICWGDGFCEWIYPQQSWEFPEIDMKQLVFTNLYTYFQLGTYEIKVSKCCWANDLLNIPDAEDYNFELAATFKLVDSSVEPLNTMASFPDPWITGNTGNFINYMTDIPAGGENTLSVQFCHPDIPGYERPDNFLPGQSDEIFLDTLDGGFVWAIPQVEGFFNLSLCATEYRNGELISETTRFISIIVDGPVGVQSPEKEGSWKVYPNPATDQLNLDVDANVADIIEISLASGAGKYLQQFGSLSPTGSNTLDVSGIPSGYYYLILKTKKGTETIPFIKL